MSRDKPVTTRLVYRDHVTREMCVVELDKHGNEVRPAAKRPATEHSSEEKKA